jgi:hypothetical protein
LSRAYYAWAIGGLVLSIAIITTVGVATEDLTGEKVLPAAVACFGVYFAGIFTFGFLQLRRQRSASTTPHPELVGTETADAGKIESVGELMAVMATERYDPEAIASAGQTSFSLGRIYLVFGALITAAGLAAVIVSANGDLAGIEISGTAAWVIGGALLAAFSGFSAYSLRRAKGVASSLLAPLGLEVTEMPEVNLGPTGSGTTVTGASVMGGRRHGREVAIAISASEHRTGVAKKVPVFRLEQEGGRLRAAGDAPAGVRKLLDGLSVSARWKRLKLVEGGPDGIVAVRKVDPESGWLWDLWLCERLAEAA